MGAETPRLRAYRRRIYDAKRGCYVYDISFRSVVPLSDRTLEVARSFGLGVDEEKRHVVYRDFELRLAEGDIVYITGDSGSGKSVILRALKEDLGERAVDIADVQVDHDRPLVDTVGSTFREALSLLSMVGLNDAFLFLRRYPELSDGQRHRYRLARMIDSGRRLWLADEFCSTLDRTTASIVAYNTQKLARRTGATLVAATTHTDLEEDLNPSIRIRKGWGDEIAVEYRSNQEAPECTATRDIAIRDGTPADYRRLSPLHYRTAHLPPHIKIYAMTRFDELVGVIAYTYPSPSQQGRRQAVGYTPRLEELNRDWATISRVVLHPKYRAAGLGARLVRETLPLVGRRHVELVAVMAQYNPFAEKAGMKKILETRPHPSIPGAIERLRTLGFNPVLLSSAAHNLARLRGLDGEQLEAVRGTLGEVSPHYLARLRGGGRPFPSAAEMREWLRTVSVERLAQSLRVLSILGETKVYLYWSADGLKGG